MLAGLICSCARAGSGPAAPVPLTSASEEQPSDSSGWLDESLAELPTLDAAPDPWDAHTCAAGQPVEPCSELPELPEAAVFELEDGVAVDWCNPEERVVVRCFGEAAEGPFELRSVVHYDADGIGFRRVDESIGAADAPLEVTIIRALPDGAHREITLQWRERSASRPSHASMLLERGGQLLRSQVFSDGVLTRDDHCVYEEGARRCTERSFEDDGSPYRAVELYEAPPLCLEASRTTWSSGAVEWVYVDRGDGPLAPLLEWSRAVWGGPPGPDEDDVAVVSSATDGGGDEPPFELRMTRVNVPCQGAGPSYRIGQGELEDGQLCVRACDSIGSNCAESQCRPISADQLEQIHAEARREVERRLPSRD